MARYMSRKFLVIVAGAVLVATGHLPAETWVMLAAAYVGVAGAIDFRRVKK